MLASAVAPLVRREAMRSLGVVMLAAALSATIVADARGDDRAAEAASIAERRAARVTCLNECGERYKTCIQRYEAKTPGVCGGSAVRCRNACPPRVETKAEPVPASEPPRGERVESVPAEQRATPREEHEVTPSARRGAAEPPAPASSPVTSSAAAPPVGAEPDAAKRQQRVDSTPVATESAPSKPHRRNWLKSALCIFRPCPDEEEEHLTCTESCSADYHECVTLGDKRRQQFCPTDLAHCKERCAAGRPADPAR